MTALVIAGWLWASALPAADALIWTPDNKANGSAMAAALSANGRSSQTVADIRNLSLSSFQYVFICLGVFPNNYVLKSDVNSSEINSLIAYLNGGGRVYMEGGDTWARDFPTSLHGKFYIHGEADGAGDLSTVSGSGCLAGYAFSYGGAKNYIDRIAPQEGAGLFFTNSQPAYGCGVGYDNGVYRTVGVSFEFGGLTDGGSTKNALMGDLLAFFDAGCALSKPAPLSLQAFGGYDRSVPLMWDAPPGQNTLDEDGSPMPSMTFARIGEKPEKTREQLLQPPTQSIAGYQATGYHVYRATSASGPFSKIASNVKRQYYRDTTAENGVTYFYTVTAVYSSGESPKSLIASAMPAANGYVIHSPWAMAVPNLDGRIEESEWASARVIDIRNSGESGVVNLYVMNRTDYLYLAVDEQNNAAPAVDDQVGIYIDQNRDGEWSYAPPYEGTFWINWNGSTTEPLYRALSGWWPGSISWQEPVSSAKINSAAATTSGRVQYEMRVDLSALSFVPPNVLPLNLFLYTLDQPSTRHRGVWPTPVLNTVWSDAWLAPVLYGTLNLASEESCERLSETQPVSGPGTVSFHTPGDGHGVTVQINTLSGSGDLTVVQSNCPYMDLPACDELPMYWTISATGISAFNADITFSYTDAEASGYTESEAFWGVAWFNETAQAWNWKGGTVDAVNNTVTVAGVTVTGDFVLFRRIFGDVSGDGYVDLDDFQRLGDVWNQTADGEFPEGTDAAFFNYGKATVDGRQIINLDDFQIFGDVWNNGVKP